MPLYQSSPILRNKSKRIKQYCIRKILTPQHNLPSIPAFTFIIGIKLNVDVFTHIKLLLKQELSSMTQFIENEIPTELMLIKKISEHVIQSGGKRIRPIIVLLVSKLCGYQGKDDIALATIIEFVHTATLLHDDVVDDSSLRRGKPTANFKWGNLPSILVGDYLYTRTLQMIIKFNRLPMVKVLTDAINALVEGELRQLTYLQNPQLTEAIYFNIIENKTAILFAAAAELMTMLAEKEALRQPLRQYALNLGLAFQLVDDLLDYQQQADTLGKNAGDDLAEGKITLPLIYALEHAKPEEKAIIQKAIADKNRESLPQIHKILVETGAYSYVQQKAKTCIQHAIAALTLLPSSDYKKALIELAEFSILRIA